MVLARANKKIETKDFRYDDGGVTGTIHTKVSKLIRRQALAMQRAKARLIAEERTAGHGHAASEQRFNRGIEPDDGNALRAQKFGSALLGVSSSAQGKHEGLLCFCCAAEDRTELLGFKRAKGGFAKTFKEFRNAQAGRFLDAVIKVNEAPGEPNYGGARHAPAKNRILRHDAGANEVNRASECELYH